MKTRGKSKSHFPATGTADGFVVVKYFVGT